MADFTNKDVVDGVDPAAFPLETDISAMEFVGRPSSLNKRMTGTVLVSEVVDKADLGTFTGSTIQDNRDIKEALQDLETAVEAVPADTNTTYGVSAETVSGGANLRLSGSDASTDDVKIASGTNVTVSRTDDSTITISASGGGDTHTEFTQDKASILGVSGAVTYVKPASLGATATLTLDSWTSLKRMAILAEKDEDYDGSSNDYVLEITVTGTTTNAWNPAGGQTGFDLMAPSVKVMNGGPTTVGTAELYEYGVSEVAVDNTPAPFTWNNGVLTLRFGGAHFKGFQRNIIFLSV